MEQSGPLIQYDWHPYKKTSEKTRGKNTVKMEEEVGFALLETILGNQYRGCGCMESQGENHLWPSLSSN